MSLWDGPLQVTIELRDAAGVELANERIDGTTYAFARLIQPPQKNTLSPLSPSKLLAGGEGPGVRGQIRR